MTSRVGREGLLPEAGRLLVATPDLVDPNFAHSVVLLLDHDEDGSLGVILNRPTAVEVGAVLSGWGAHATDPAVVFEGGPVSPDAALALAGLAPTSEPEAAADPVGFRRLFGATGVLDLDTPQEVLDPRVVRLRVFAGYAGWGTDQLEAEIEEGAWHVLASLATDAFSPRPERLWADVLRRQPGSLAWTSTRPLDPTQN